MLREVLERDPRSTGALFSIERVLTRKGEPEAILPLVADFLAMEPGRAQVRLLELRVLSEVDSLDAVRRKADEWRETHPSEDTYRDLVELYSSTFGAGEALELVASGRSALDEPGLLAFEVGELQALQRGGSATCLRDETKPRPRWCGPWRSHRSSRADVPPRRSRWSCGWKTRLWRSRARWRTSWADVPGPRF